jgi:hypothetical protein
MAELISHTAYGKKRKEPHALKLLRSPARCFIASNVRTREY